LPLPVDRVDVGEHDVAVRQLGDDQLLGPRGEKLPFTILVLA